MTVVVPSYRRARQLAQCLEGLSNQTLRPRAVVVVVREGDRDTETQLDRSTMPGLRAVHVAEPGVLAALRAGVASTDTDLVAMTDDDAVPRPDWLARLLPHFADPSVGAAGGRDAVHQHDTVLEPTPTEVGRISTWGKVTGNHHLGLGHPRDVLVLKGVNMAFRKEALAFPERLRGSGPQVHHELASSLWAVRRGWRLIYDPEAVVDHYPGDRFGADTRVGFAPQATQDAAYNLTAVLLSLGPCPAWRRLAFGLLVGDRRTPGVVRALVAAVRPGDDRVVTRHLVPSLAGQLQAYRDWRCGQGIVMSAPIPEVEA